MQIKLHTPVLFISELHSYPKYDKINSYKKDLRII